MQKFLLERGESSLESFFREGRCNQQKTYDNKTGEHTSGQGPIFIQDWQTHLEYKEHRADEWIGSIGVCAQAHKKRTK